MICSSAMRTAQKTLIQIITPDIPIFTILILYTSSYLIYVLFSLFLLFLNTFLKHSNVFISHPKALFKIIRREASAFLFSKSLPTFLMIAGRICVIRPSQSKMAPIFISIVLMHVI